MNCIFCIDIQELGILFVNNTIEYKCFTNVETIIIKNIDSFLFITKYEDFVELKFYFDGLIYTQIFLYEEFEEYLINDKYLNIDETKFTYTTKFLSEIKSFEYILFYIFKEMSKLDVKSATFI